jgi:hypothetical protein
MGWATILGFVINIFNWIWGNKQKSEKKAQEALSDVVHEMKKPSEAVKLHKRSVKQKLRGKLRRKDLLDKKKAKK